MGWLFKGNEQSNTDKGAENYESFSTPFLSIGKGNLSLPQVQKRIIGHGGSVKFGASNLFPNLLNQMYYTSPLNSAIIDYKTNAVIGGGFRIEENDGVKDADKVNIYTFERRNKINKIAKIVTKELIAHERIYFIVSHKNIIKNGEKIGIKPIKFDFVSSDKVRVRPNKKDYLIADDWSQSTSIRKIKKLHPSNTDLEQIYVYENYSMGQDYYPIPAYSTALNWCFLDGESSYLHKTNIIESIFPSFALMFPKKTQNDEELEAIKTTIENAKGAQNAGRIFSFFANKKEQLPEIQAVPKNNNDTLFNQTDERIDNKICQAHVIDPMLMGIRVGGKLGGGTDIKQAYVILEKNTVLPRRGEVEEIFNELISIFGIKGEFKINDYQIVNETIIEVDGESKGASDAINKLSPLVATKVLDNLTQNEIRNIGGLKKVRGGDEIKSKESAQFKIEDK